MRIKISYCFAIGIVLGLFFGFILPAEGAVFDVFNTISEITTHLAWYFVFPLVFFSVAVGVCQLRRDENFLKVSSQTLLYALIAVVVITLFGLLITLIAGADRMKITYREDVSVALLGWKEIFFAAVPKNFFTIFTEGKILLFPLYLFSFFLGFHFFHDQEIAEPAYNFFDSMSRLLFRMQYYLMFALGILLLFSVTKTILSFRLVNNINNYLKLIILLGSLTVFIVFVFYPLIAYFLDRKNSPVVSISAMAAPLMVAFFTGDAIFSLGVATCYSKKNLGISRKVGTVTLPFLVLFSRAGTSLVTAITMLFLIKSHSNLDITLFQVLWVFVFSILASLITFYYPGGAVYPSLAFVCKSYDRFMNEAHLIIIPIIPILHAFAMTINIATSMFLLLMIAGKDDYRNNVRLRDIL